MFEELGIRGGTAIVILVVLYFVIKWAVKNGVREALGIKDKMEKTELEEIRKIFNSAEDKSDTDNDKSDK